MKYSHLTHDEFDRIAHNDAASELELEFVKRWAEVKEEEAERSMETLGEQLSEAQEEISQLTVAVNRYQEHKNKLRYAVMCAVESMEHSAAELKKKAAEAEAEFDDL